VTPAQILEAISSRISILILQNKSRAEAERIAVEEIATQYKIAPPLPPSIAAPSETKPSQRWRTHADWVYHKLMTPLTSLPSRKPTAPPSLVRKPPTPHITSPRRVRPRSPDVPAPTPEPSDASSPTVTGPLIYVSGTHTPHYIDDEFQNDARYRDQATSNWRAQNR
jgi:hypothetical protein